MPPLSPSLPKLLSLLLLPFFLILVPTYAPPPSPPNPSSPTKTAPENICLNDCSGHGTCHSYTCTCDPPYSGDDCSHAPPDFFSSSQSPQQPKLAPLQSGHFNVTSKKRMRKLVKQPGGMLVGFSAPASSCSICAAFESSYMDVYSWMLEVRGGIVSYRCRCSPSSKFYPLTPPPHPPRSSFPSAQSSLSPHHFRQG